MTGQFDLLREIEDFANRFKGYMKDVDPSGKEQKGDSSPVRIPISIYRDAQTLYVELEIPGVRKEDVEINIVGDALEVSGRKEARNGYSVLAQERWFGAFRRQVRIPESRAFDLSRAAASFENGLLKIAVPRIEAQESPRVSVPIQ